MIHQTLIDPTELATHLDDPNWAVVDCRYSVTDALFGERSYLGGHIPGAVYADLDRNLSAPPVPGRTGRHPLPEVRNLARTFGEWGIGPGVQVVAYDDLGSAIAARLWWLARWLGHDAVAVLDGGWQRWCAEGHPIARGFDSREPRIFMTRLGDVLVADVEAVTGRRTDPNYRLLDARAADRYRGENEPLDPVAGHIPGAISAPYADNLAPDGRFLPADALRARFEELLAGVPPDRAIVYCGSGVTATHHLLAMAHVGLGQARLYAGSWSEWITNPGRPVATGTSDQPGGE